MAGTHSGCGKTTVATGLMAALRAAGHAVAPAKVGPDFIDPGYHELATGRTGRNLDVFLGGDGAIPALAARAQSGADVLVVEGVMGLFDGVGATGESSTGQVAELLAAPVLLVVDTSAMSASVAALVHGYDDTFRRRHGRGLGGVILNKVGSPTHESVLREALEGTAVPVLGVVRRDPALSWRDRHLGLVPVVERRPEIAAALGRLAAAVTAGTDLAAVLALARSAPAVSPPPLRPARRVGRPRIAVVSGPAFSFAYPDNLERLAEAGAELVPFDPVDAPALPDGVTGLYAGGGFPEVYAEALAANAPLLADVRRRTASGLVTWAECGGMLWLCRSLDGVPLCGAVEADAVMADRVCVGYRSATVRVANPVAPAGAVLRGHELHYSRVDPPGDALDLSGRSGSARDGFASATMLASYLHVHLGADPAPGERFVAAAARRPSSGPHGAPVVSGAMEVAGASGIPSASEA